MLVEQPLLGALHLDAQPRHGVRLQTPRLAGAAVTVRWRSSIASPYGSRGPAGRGDAAAARRGRCVEAVDQVQAEQGRERRAEYLPGRVQVGEGLDLLAVEEEQAGDTARQERLDVLVPGGGQRLVWRPSTRDRQVLADRRAGAAPAPADPVVARVPS